MKDSSKKWLSFLLTAMIATSSASSVSAAWNQDNQGDWNWKEDNKEVTGWKQIDNSWYYFAQDGKMQTGWLNDSQQWYYLNNSGSMVTGWLKDQEQWYHLGAQGNMATGWIKVNDKWYYLNNSGNMATGWKEIDGEWYYLNQNGDMQTGWAEINGKWYYLADKGDMSTGWELLNGTWYYLNANGDMATGWITHNGKTYFADANGAMQTGLIRIDNYTYYFAEDGSKQTGDIVIDKQTYRFDADGRAISPVPTPSKCFNSNGVETYFGGNGSNSDSSGEIVTPEDPYQTVVVKTAQAQSNHEIRVVLSVATKDTLSKDAFTITSENGENIAVESADTTNDTDKNKVYQLTTAEYPEGNYTLNIQLPNGRTISKVFTFSAQAPVQIADVTATRTSQTQAEISFTADKAGTIYYVLKTDDTVPSADEIIENNVSAAVQAGENTITISDLEQAGAYSFYFVSKTEEGVISEVSDAVQIQAASGEQESTGASRTEDNAAVFTFQSEQPGYVYCLVQPNTATRAVRATPTQDEIRENGVKYSMKEGTNTIPVAGLEKNTSYSLYYASTDLYEDFISEEVQTVAISAEIQKPVASGYEGIDIAEIKTIENGKIDVVLSKATPTPLNKKSFGVFCPAGSEMTIIDVTTTDSKTYHLTTAYYDDNTYYLEVDLTDNKVLQKQFESRYDCPQITVPEIVRTSDTSASFKFASDSVGTIYCLPVAKTQARARAAIEVNDIKAKGQRFDFTIPYNTLDIQNLSAGTAYDLYYLGIGQDGKETPVLGPISIQAEPVKEEESAAKMVSCNAISDDQIKIVFDKEVPGLTSANFALRCPKGPLKLGKVSTSDNKTYYVSLRVGSMFMEKVNYTITAAFNDGSTVSGVFYTDLYGAQLSGMQVIRYSETDVSFIFTADRNGYVYYMPSSIAYNDYENKPSKETVLQNSKKIAIKAGQNVLDLTDVGMDAKTLFLVTENNYGYQIEFVDMVRVPEEITEKPGEADPEANYTVTSFTGEVISNSYHKLKIVLDSKDGSYPMMISGDDVIITGPGTYLSGTRQISGESSFDGYNIFFLKLNGKILDPGEYTIQMTLYSETGEDVIYRTFTVNEDLTVVS